MTKIIRLYRRIMAYWRLDQQIVCEESIGMGLYDYHDYRDSLDGEPWHHCTMKCKHCDKEFMI